MTNETFTFEIAKAYGKDLPAALTVNGAFEAYVSFEEMRTAGDVLSNDEQLSVRNAKRKAAARAAATTEALDAAGIKKPSQDDPEVIASNMVKLIAKQHGVSEEIAQKIYQMTQDAAKALTA